MRRDDFLIACLAGITFGTLAVLVWNDAQKYPAMWADRALCESRGGVWLTAPVEPGCYRIEEVVDAPLPASN